MNKSFKYFFIVPFKDEQAAQVNNNKFVGTSYVLFFFKKEISAPVVKKEDYWYEYLTAEEVGQCLGGN